MAELIIAEKPSAALKIATSLAEGKIEKHDNKKVSYYEITHNNKKLIVACAVGHLYNLAEKEKKGWTYPVFEIEWKPSYETSKSSAFTKPYLEIIKKLSKDATEIYNACDLDIEGEIIFKNILNFACHKKDAKRMKFSTTTKEDLTNAFEHAEPHIDFKLAEAGETRHFLDHYWGINLSRALTLSVKSATGMFKILSSGRVQGPALKILAERELQIKNFKPVPFWQVELFTKDFNAMHEEDKIFDKSKAENIFQKANVNKATISSVDKQRFKQEPPHPFDLTALQLEAYRQLGISPKETLSICQDLYVNSYISYPRTSSNQLPESIGYRKIIEKLSKQEQYRQLCQKLLKLNSLKPNNGKKTDPAHPAIYATGEVPTSLELGARKVYDLIVRRILATFADPAERESVFVEIDANGEKFNTKGVTTVYKGWHEFYGTYARFEEIELPSLDQGQIIDVMETKLYEKETTPPKRYSPASVIKALESRGLGTKSISGNTLVYINGDWKPISKLFDEGGRTHEKLLTRIPFATFYELNGKKLGLKKEILAAKRLKEPNEKIFSIETKFTRLISDSKHKYFLINEKGIISEKEAGLIRPNETLLFTKLTKSGNPVITNDWLSSLNRKYKLKEKNGLLYYQNGAGFKVNSLPILESNKLFWLLGYIYGDGSTYKRKEYDGYDVTITIDKKESFLISKLITTIEDLFGKGCYGITTPSNRNTIRINIPSVISYYLVKKFPALKSKSIFNIPKEYRSDFIKGYMDSDGNVHLRGKGKVLIGEKAVYSHNTARIKFTLSRKEHISWIKKMLNSLGISTTPIKQKIARIKEKSYPCFELKISGKNDILLYSIFVGFEHPKKREILYNGLLSDSLQYEPIRNLIYCFCTLLKNDNKLTKFKDKLTGTLKKFADRGILERKRICKGYSRKFAVRIPDKFITQVSNFLLPIFGKEIIPWSYRVKVINKQQVNFDEKVLYDLIVDSKNPTFVILGGQVIHNSTRAEIIDTLFQRNYVSGTSIEVTDLGLKTIDTLNRYCPEILDEKLTHDFEEDMDEIIANKNNEEDILKHAREFLTQSLEKFKANEKKIGEGLGAALKETRDKENLVGKCKLCGSDLSIRYSPRFKSRFVACNGYPNCKNTFSLPMGLPKVTDKTCPDCEFPMVLIIRAGKRPFEYCINKMCPKKVEWRKQQEELKNKEAVKDDSSPVKQSSIVKPKEFQEPIKTIKVRTKKKPEPIIEGSVKKLPVKSKPKRTFKEKGE